MSKVFTFFSSIGNIGLTTTVLSVADTISKITNSKVAVLNLNAWDDGTDYFAEPEFTLDQIKSRLSGKMFLNTEDFTGKFNKLGDNLYILPGNRNRRTERLYDVDEVKYLIERTKEVFDVVLVDAGSHIDNALTAGAFDMSDKLYLILNQQDKAAKQFNQIYNDVLIDFPIVKSDLKLIMTNYQDKSYLLNAEKVSREIGVPLVAMFPRVETGWLCEIEKSWSNLTDNKEYAEQAFILAEAICFETNLVVLDDGNKKKKGFFRIFG